MEDDLDAEFAYCGAFFRCVNIPATFNGQVVGIGTLYATKRDLIWINKITPNVLMKCIGPDIPKDTAETKAGYFSAERPDLPRFPPISMFRRCRPEEVKCPETEKAGPSHASSGPSGSSGTSGSSEAAGCSKKDDGEEPNETNAWLFIDKPAKDAIRYSFDVTFAVVSIERSKERFLKPDVPDYIRQAIDQLPFVVVPEDDPIFQQEEEPEPLAEDVPPRVEERVETSDSDEYVHTDSSDIANGVRDGNSTDEEGEEIELDQLNIRENQPAQPRADDLDPNAAKAA